MIYYFGTGENVSVVFKGETLTELEKTQATLVTETETEPEKVEGYIAYRFIDPITKVFSWKQRAIVDFNLAESLKVSVIKHLITPEQYKLITGIDYV